MTSARKKPGAVFWTMVVVSLAMLYPVSFGPACWTSKGHRLPSFADQLLHWVYSPLADYAITESNPAATALRRWAYLGAEHGPWNLQRNATIHVPPYHSPPYL